MFCCPCQFINSNFYRATPANSYIRVLNASPNTSSVDVYLDGKLIAQNLTYKSFSKYIPMGPGNHNIKIYPTGQLTNPLIDTMINLPPGFAFNLALIGYQPNLTLYAIPEPFNPQTFGTACIRFVHLSPTAPAVDITLTDGKKIFNNVKYEDFSVYACVPPGTYTLQVRSAGTNDILLTVPGVQLMPNKYYSIYAVGIPGGSPPLEALVVEEGISNPI